MDLEVKEILLQNQLLELHPYKSVYWKREKTLWVSDLHLGKTNHFQKAGIPIPDRVSDENWNRLYHILDIYHPKKVLFMGDLFHSSFNVEWEIFGRYLNAFGDIEYHLIMGNHDILHREQYLKFGIILHEDSLTMPPFLFTHHPLKEVPVGQYNICGHIHPAVRMRGAGRQGLKVPCYYFGAHQGILPAFGAFTGTAAIKPNKEDQLYLVVEEQIIPIHE